MNLMQNRPLVSERQVKYKVQQLNWHKTDTLAIQVLRQRPTVFGVYSKFPVWKDFPSDLRDEFANMV